MCPYYNSPIRRSSDGSWFDYSTNQTINLDEMWHKGQPNGQPIEECLSYSKTGQFHDTRCETSDGCFVCVWRHEPTFTLRGLCSETTIDRDYVLLPNTTYDQNVLFGVFWKDSEDSIFPPLIIFDLLILIIDSIKISIVF